jgi:hypothetical protein
VIYFQRRERAALDGLLCHRTSAIQKAAFDALGSLLAKFYLQQREWDALEGLLRHRTSAVRKDALDALHFSLASTTPGIIAAAAALLADTDVVYDARDAFAHRQMESVSPLVVPLVECLDNDNAKVRALAVDSILHHLEAVVGDDIGGDGKDSKREPSAPALGKAAKELTKRLPLLVRHIVKPRSAPWDGDKFFPNSRRLRDDSKKLTTRLAAAAALAVLMQQSKASKNRVREALEGERRHVQDILSCDDEAGLELGPELGLLVRQTLGGQNT